jgi:hypothetical protein
MLSHWINNEAEIMALKAGDAVLIRWGHSHAERTVTRVTATQVLIGETRYRRTGGYKAGSEIGRSLWSNARIVALTPALRAEREAQDKHTLDERHYLVARPAECRGVDLVQVDYTEMEERVRTYGAEHPLARVYTSTEAMDEAGRL